MEESKVTTEEKASVKKKEAALQYNAEQACNILHINHSNRKVFEKLHHGVTKTLIEWGIIFSK